MKKVLLYLLCILTVIALVSCDGDGASSKPQLTTEQVVEKIVDSEMLNSMTDGISAFCSVEPEWGTDFSSTLLKHGGTNYIKRVEENATIISTGKPYHAIVEFPVESKVLSSLDEVFLIDLDGMLTDQSNPETLTIVESESVEFGGIAEQSSTCTTVINIAKLEELQEYFNFILPAGTLWTGFSDYCTPYAAEIEANPEVVFGLILDYLNTKRTEIASKIDAAFSCSVVFSKVVVDGVSYDPAPIGTYLSSHFGDYMTDQTLIAVRMIFEEMASST